MWPVKFKLSIFFPFLLAACLVEPVQAEQWWRVFGEVKQGNFYGGYYNEEEAILTGRQKEVLKKDQFEEWTTYEDEFVKLYYPKHPDIRFVKNEGEGGISVEGGVCTTVDNSFSRAYSLKVGSVTYGVFLLNPAAWLDDGI